METDSAIVRPGGLVEVGQIIEGLGASRILLLTGDRSFEKSGAAAAISSVLSGRNCCHIRQSPLVVCLEELDKLVPALRKFNPDLILAIGGGAVIDSAKGLSALATNHCSATQLLENDLSALNAVPVVAVPTTAGTGSEATSFAAVYLAGRKFSLASPILLPYAAIVDANLTRSLPPYETACSGLDAMAQAIESFWSRRATSESREYSRESLRLSFGSLIAAVKDGDFDARVNMARAAHLAGKAINIAGTTAAHAFSYGFTYDFKIPHGHAVALTLPEFFDYNTSRRDVEFEGNPNWNLAAVGELCGLLNVTTTADACDQLRRMIRECGLATALQDLQITADDLRSIAEKVDAVRLANNPRLIPREEFVRILERACRG
ncbi:MAG: phosphonoacetaldehyde reductase [Candidatus Obscuribacterales bacterium]|nr:phosphonoacetaldehyde reductase [Candidatus Obscuribacterales bacterium]